MRTKAQWRGRGAQAATGQACAKSASGAIPGADSKSFIKLRQHEQITPRLLAYFEQSSEVSKQISQSDGLLWGRSGICTVTVKWNTDRPGRPYVQLVGIDSFSWQP